MKKSYYRLRNKIGRMVVGLKLTKKKFNSIELVLVVVMALILGLLTGEILFDGKSTSSNEFMEIESTYKRLLSDYYGDVDSKKLTDAAISGMMSAVDDKYSAYFTEEQSEQFELELNGSFIGLGATIGMNKGNQPIIVQVIENSPAEKAKLQVNDRIVSINGKSVEGLSLSEITGMIKGDIPKNVSMVVIRDKREVTVKFTTGKVNIPSVTSEVVTLGNKKVGYIYISIFALNTDEQFKSHLEKLMKAQVDRFVIDVRDNTGGHLETVQNIASLFLTKEQVVCQIKNKTTTKKLYSSGTTTLGRKYPMVVLTNGGSASGSEVLAAALKEEYGAILVGTKTYGKGTVQKYLELSTGSSIKYTAEEWLTSKGNSINNKGIEPDVKLELDKKYFDTYDKKDDNQYQKALSILESK